MKKSTLAVDFFGLHMGIMHAAHGDCNEEEQEREVQLNRLDLHYAPEHMEHGQGQGLRILDNSGPTTSGAVPEGYNYALMRMHI